MKPKSLFRMALNRLFSLDISENLWYNETNTVI